MPRVGHERFEQRGRFGHPYAINVTAISGGRSITIVAGLRRSATGVIVAGASTRILAQFSIALIEPAGMAIIVAATFISFLAAAFASVASAFISFLAAAFASVASALRSILAAAFAGIFVAAFTRKNGYR